jgi:hypothetical protein
MGSITVAKCDRGYYVKGNQSETNPIPGPEESWLLQVTPAIEGATVRFDNTVPMTVKDMQGRTLNVHYCNDNNIITLIEDAADLGKQLVEVEIDVESGFWFLTAGNDKL